MRWGRVAAAYLLLGLLAFVIIVTVRNASPMVHPRPWLALPARASHTYSLMVGLAFGALIVVLTRFAVARFAWARSLHGALRPLARGMSTPVIVLLAVLSAFAEELLFRGLLQPWIGVVPQAVIFGVAHYIPGPSRWVWAGWAAVVGLALGGMFQLSGSLLGPVVAHAVINGLNLSYLRAHDPQARRELGGLLGQQPNP